MSEGFSCTQHQLLLLTASLLNMQMQLYSNYIILLCTKMQFYAVMVYGVCMHR